MRRPSNNPGELKTIVKPIRMTENEYDLLKEKARSHGVSDNEWVRRCIKAEPITPEVVCRIHNLCDIMEKIVKETNNEDLTNFFNKEMNWLWSLLR